ncbi:hypothetical protein [Winogradskyella costae]|uniref:hypothetical protein n=1 Tax=Winogradskyella costae TaxID=2697008 RepID=UPI0015C92E33|nr:hypothetical protein [Winogradskyella costae]
MNKVELIRQIRFGFEQLKSDNGTSDFEHICRFFARSRIVQNVIPATGPVQSGGDQGRDFETFHSYLIDNNDKNFSLAYSKAPIVFACSLEKNPLKKNGKIDKDVKTILEPNLSIERIYFFSGIDIPVGQRHKKEKEIKINYNVDLEIIDAQALSEHLSDSDLFWVANQYLKIPNDFFPRVTETNWYNNIYKEYKTREVKITFEEFSDIKSAIRHIYKDKVLKIDLNFWLELLDLFISDSSPRILKRKAIYEKFVTKLMGQNNINNLEIIVRDYFSDIRDYPDPASMEDAQILLSFVKSSKLIIGNEISNDEIDKYANELNVLLESEFNNTNSNNKKSSIIEIQANIILNDFDNAVIKYLEKLEEIFEYVQDAPFYPLERLSNRILESIKLNLELKNDTSLLESFSEKLDGILAERYGAYRAGENIRDRVQLYLKANKTVKAITLLHQLKMKWFSNETLRGSILTSILLSDCYSKLNMEYASKYYSMIAANMAIVYKGSADVFDLLPSALKRTADSSYNSGSWVNYLDLIDLTINSYHFIEKDFDIYKDDETSTLIYYPALIKLFSNKFNLTIENYLDFKFKKLGYIGDEIIEFYEKINVEGKELFKKSNIVSSLSEQIRGIPFNDIGELRVISFEAFGIKWNIEFKNDYITNSMAEQLVAMLQVFLVELIDEELFLIKSNVLVRFKKTKNDQPLFTEKPSNEQIIWEAEIPFYQGNELNKIEECQYFYSALIGAILRQISLLPNNEFKEIIENKFGQGLFNKVTFGNTYNYLYREFISENGFNESQRTNFSNVNITLEYSLPENTKVPWPTGLSKTYSKEENLTYIKKRLAFTAPLEITLEKLKNNDDFILIINEFRENWSDWHIYLAIVNIVINYKLQKIGLKLDNPDKPHEFQKKYLEYSRKKESEWMIELPMGIFSKENIENYMLRTGVVSVLPSYGLQNFSCTPNLVAIKDLLIERFNFLKDGKDLTIF